MIELDVAPKNILDAGQDRFAHALHIQRRGQPSHCREKMILFH